MAWAQVLEKFAGAFVYMSINDKSERKKQTYWNYVQAANFA